MREFLALFGNFTLLDTVTLIVALAFVFDKARKFTSWMKNWLEARDKEKEFYDTTELNAKDIYILKEGMKAILQLALIERLQEHLSEESITAEDADELGRLFMTYESLGGNGKVKQLYLRASELPYRIM